MPQSSQMKLKFLVISKLGCTKNIIKQKNKKIVELLVIYYLQLEKEPRKEKCESTKSRKFSKPDHGFQILIHSFPINTANLSQKVRVLIYSAPLIGKIVCFL